MSTYKKSETKDTEQHDLLRLTQLQTANYRQGQHKDQDIGDDVTGRIRIPKLDQLDTGSGGLGLPELVHGYASEDYNEQLRNRPQKNKYRGGDDVVLHSLGSQYAVVLEQERHLDGGQGAVVEHDGNPECLGYLLAYAVVLQVQRHTRKYFGINSGSTTTI